MQRTQGNGLKHGHAVGLQLGRDLGKGMQLRPLLSKNRLPPLVVQPADQAKKPNPRTQSPKTDENKEASLRIPAEEHSLQPAKRLLAPLRQGKSQQIQDAIQAIGNQALVLPKKNKIKSKTKKKKRRKKKLKQQPKEPLQVLVKTMNDKSRNVYDLAKLSPREQHRNWMFLSAPHLPFHLAPINMGAM